MMYWNEVLILWSFPLHFSNGLFFCYEALSFSVMRTQRYTKENRSLSSAQFCTFQTVLPSFFCWPLLHGTQSARRRRRCCVLLLYTCVSTGNATREILLSSSPEFKRVQSFSQVCSDRLQTIKSNSRSRRRKGTGVLHPKQQTFQNMGGTRRTRTWVEKNSSIDSEHTFVRKTFN
jgi:hypothetical protein